MVPDVSETGGRDHYSLKLKSGSIIYIVRGTRFKLPKSLLEQNNISITPVGVVPLTHLVSDGDTLGFELDDSLLAFTELVGVLLDPFESCLYWTPRSPEDMKKLLLLASITQKYGASKLKGRAITLLTELVTLNTVRCFLGPYAPVTGESLRERVDSSGTTGKLSPADALELSINAQCDELSSIFRAVLEDDIWEGRMHPYDAFCAAQRIDDEPLMGAACYMLMRRHPDVMMLPDTPQLSLPQRVAIERGRAYFYREWDWIAAMMSDGTLVRTEVGLSWDRHKGDFEELSLGATWKYFARRRVPSYDVLQRIDITCNIVC